MRPSPEFEGIVLAGVHTWCESAFELAEARPLVPLAGRPLLCHALAWLRDNGARRATICANSESPAVRRRLGDGSRIGIELDYYEDWLPRGTAGCIRDAALGARTQRLVVVDGTLVPQLDLRAMLDQHMTRGAALTLAVETAAHGGLQPVGVHVAEKSAVELVSAIGYQDLKEVAIPRLHQAHRRVEAFSTDAPSPRVSGAWSYLEAHGWLLENAQHAAQFETGYRALGPCWIHETAHVDARVRLIGPVMIGPRSQVEADAVLVGPVSIGEDCRIEASALVSRTAVWNRCHVRSCARVDASILVHEATVACGETLRGAVVAPTPRDARFGRRGAGGGAARARGTRRDAPVTIAAAAQPTF